MCLVELTETPKCLYIHLLWRGSVVSASRVYITLTLNLPLLSQLWQRGLCQHCMYSQMLYQTSLSCLEWMDNFSWQGKQNLLQSHLKLFSFLWALVKPFWKSVIHKSYKILLRSNFFSQDQPCYSRHSLALWSHSSQHLRRHLCVSCRSSTCDILGHLLFFAKS